MSVTDTWGDWSATAASNTPSGGATPEIDDELRNIKAQVKANVVALSGNQTVAGIKTFSSFPVLPKGIARAYLDGTADFTSDTAIKVPFNTSLFDDSSLVDTSNNCIAPVLPGYYQVNGAVGVQFDVASTEGHFRVYLLNPATTATSYGNRIIAPGDGKYNVLTVADVMYFDGTNDTVELWTEHATGEDAYIDGDGKATYLSILGPF